MTVDFTKVEGLGNDFILFDGRVTQPPLDPRSVMALCDRHHGVGADGVLVLTASPLAAARLNIWNADGSTAEMCGNGLRCAGLLLLEELAAEEVLIETAVGLHRCRLAPGGEVWAELLGLAVAPSQTLTVGGHTVQGRRVTLGNPHFVLRGQTLDDLDALGPALERDAIFAPQRTNVEVYVPASQGLTVRVWERGVGLTEACGTGAAATAAAAWADGVLPAGPTRVTLPGGTLEIAPLAANRLSLQGPARCVYRGQVTL